MNKPVIQSIYKISHLHEAVNVLKSLAHYEKSSQTLASPGTRIHYNLKTRLHKYIGCDHKF